MKRFGLKDQGISLTSHRSKLRGEGGDAKLGLVNIGGKRSFFHFTPIMANPKNTKNNAFSEDLEVLSEPF